MLETISRINKKTTEMELKIRIGVHTGPVVAGVIGKNNEGIRTYPGAILKSYNPHSFLLIFSVHFLSHDQFQEQKQFFLLLFLH